MCLSVHKMVGISSPMPFLGGGYLEYQVVGMSRGWVCLTGRYFQGCYVHGVGTHSLDMGPQEEGEYPPAPPELGYHEIQSASERYKSYWNAVLLFGSFCANRLFTINNCARSGSCDNLVIA